MYRGRLARRLNNTCTAAILPASYQPPNHPPYLQSNPFIVMIFPVKRAD